jgi:hypothetical protein
MPQTPQIGEDVTALMGGAGQSPPSAAPPVGADVTHLMQTPTFHTENQKDANGNAVVDPAALASALGVNMAGIDPSAAGHALLNVVKGWVDAGPHAVVEGLRDIWHGNYAKGAHGVITGAATTAAPMVAPEVLPAIAAAPGAAAADGGAGYAGSAGASRLASAVGATPDQAALAGDVAGLGAGAPSRRSVCRRWRGGARTARPSRWGRLHAVHARHSSRARRERRRRASRAAVPRGGPQQRDSDRRERRRRASARESGRRRGRRNRAARRRDMVQQFPNAPSRRWRTPSSSASSQMPGSSPADLAAARQVIREYGLDQPRSLAEADSLRIRLNAENRSAGRARASAAHRHADRCRLCRATGGGQSTARWHLRLAGTERRRRHPRLAAVGRLDSEALRNAADPFTRGLRGESTVARTGTTSLTRRVGQKVAQLGGAALGAAFGGPVGAALARRWAQSLTAGLTAKNMSKNELLERAFRQSFTSPPVMSVQGIPQSILGAGRLGRTPLIRPAPQLPRGTARCHLDSDAKTPASRSRR